MNIKISLNVFERQFILMIADRANDVTMNLDSVSKEAKEALDRLEKKDVIYTIPVIGTKSKIYKLTSTGITLVDMIRAKQ